jgi:hypothetical protein
MVVIADESKLVERLGRFPLPIEVVPFGLAFVRRAIAAALAATGCAGPLVLRTGTDGPFVTDGGNWILDAQLGSIARCTGCAANGAGGNGGAGALAPGNQTRLTGAPAGTVATEPLHAASCAPTDGE